MRKLYNEFFYIPKHGKIREKVMLARVAMTTAIMVVCLAAMSITAYAYFSYNVTSGYNIIKAANFETDVTVQITDADGKAVETITTNTSDHKSHSATLEANKTYSIALQHTERSTAETGFVIITAENCETRYHTQQLGRDGDGKTLTVTFSITPGANTIVTFRSHWGTSCFYPNFTEIGENDERYITQGEKIELIIGGAEPNSDEGGTESIIDTTGETNTTPSIETTTPTTDAVTVTEPSTPTSGSATPTTDITTSTETTSPETAGTSEPTSTTEPSTSTTESTTTQSAETTSTETTGKETTEPATTEPAVTTETQPTTENSEATGATTTDN